MFVNLYDAPFERLGFGMLALQRVPIRIRLKDVGHTQIVRIETCRVLDCGVELFPRFRVAALLQRELACHQMTVERRIIGERQHARGEQDND